MLSSFANFTESNEAGFLTSFTGVNASDFFDIASCLDLLLLLMPLNRSAISFFASVLSVRLRAALLSVFIISDFLRDEPPVRLCEARDDLATESRYSRYLITSFGKCTESFLR